MSQDTNVQMLMENWKEVLDNKNYAPITDSYKRKVTAILLENEHKAVMSENQLLNETYPTVVGSGALGTAATGGAIDPVLISLVRRAMPQLIAYDICGVQPMTMPTGLIFAMRSRYANASLSTTTTGGATEALFYEADTFYSGATGANPATQSGTDPFSTYTIGTAMPTATGEGITPLEMGFTIEKITVTAQTRALKSEYTLELSQDLKAIHGLEAESELANILTAEIMAEINREIIRTMYYISKAGAQKGTTTAGAFDLDVDSDGRWSVERFKGLMFQAERDANFIAKDTRRGKGNFLVVSSDVASALAMAGKLDYAPALSSDLDVDEAANTFCGTLNGRYKVYVDPYFSSTTNDLMLVGYKGTTAYDAGLFYCPYVPLTQVKAIDPNTFQPKIGFKTRYGLVANPFFGSTPGALSSASNGYFRIVKVLNLM